jgi:hypothetical protein
MVGWLSCPDGWETQDYYGIQRFKSASQDWTRTPPTGAKPEGAIALANAIKDMGALSVTNVMGNMIGKEQLAKLQEIMHSKPNLVSLCGIADDATEADLSGLNMDADDAIVLSAELPDKGAMTSLDISGNYIGPEGAKHIAGAVKVSKCVLAIILAPLSCQSDQYFNCWCLLLSPGHGGHIHCYCQYIPSPNPRHQVQV